MYCPVNTERSNKADERGGNALRAGNLNKRRISVITSELFRNDRLIS